MHFGLARERSQKCRAEEYRVVTARAAAQLKQLFCAQVHHIVNQKENKVKNERRAIAVSETSEPQPDAQPGRQ